MNNESFKTCIFFVSDLKKVEIQNYCIAKYFELVELDPFSESSDDDLEDDFKESLSFERLYQAIQAYVWPNLSYKRMLF